MPRFLNSAMNSGGFQPRAGLSGSNAVQRSARPVDIVFVLPQGHLNLPAAPKPVQQGASHYWVDKRERLLIEIGPNALLTVKCRIENNRRADFLDWRVCRADAWPKEWDAPYPAFPVCRRHKCRWRAFRVRRRLKPQVPSAQDFMNTCANSGSRRNESFMKIGFESRKQVDNRAF